MKIYRSALQDFDGSQSVRSTMAELGINDLGAPETPVQVEFTVHQQEEDFLLNGVVRVDLVLVCDRCLNEAHCPVEGSFKVWLTAETRSDLDAEEDEVLPFPSHQREVDISGIITGVIYTEVPGKILCRETCRGLCPICGADLNTQPCACSTDEIDERWSALMAVKEKLEE